MLGSPRSIVALGFWIGRLALLLAGAAGLALAWKTGNTWRVDWLAVQLADRAVQAETSAAQHYCAKLGELGAAGAPQLARLAAEPNAELARTARRTIDVRMGAALARTVAARGAQMDEADQQELEALAQALSAQAMRTPGSAQRWFEGTARQLMAPIEAYDARRAMRILARCDETLRTLHARRQQARSRVVSRSDLPRPSSPANALAMAQRALGGSVSNDGAESQGAESQGAESQGAESQGAESRQAERPENSGPVRPFAPQRAAVPSDGTPLVEAAPDAAKAGPCSMRRHDAPSDSRTARDVAPHQWQRRDRGALHGIAPPDANTEGGQQEYEPSVAPPESGARPLAEAARPTEVAPSTMRVIDVPGPDVLRRRVRQYRAMSPAELAAALKTADPYETRAIERVRAEKGIRLEASAPALERGGPSLTEVAPDDGSASPPTPTVDPPRSRSSVGDRSARNPSRDDRADRLASILSAPAAKFPALRLRQLVEDPDPRVRREALTALATTSDPQLEQIARRHALRDPDPEVADAAKRILEGMRR